MAKQLTYDELKKENKKALSALITLWEELSRCSREFARQNLKEDWGFRYSVTEKKQGLVFKDEQSGDKFRYHNLKEEWIDLTIFNEID